MTGADESPTAVSFYHDNPPAVKPRCGGLFVTAHGRQQALQHNAANEAGIDDPTFVSLGEEVRAWKLLLDERFESVWEEIDGLVSQWFALEEGES